MNKHTLLKPLNVLILIRQQQQNTAKQSKVQHNTAQKTAEHSRTQHNTPQNTAEINQSQRGKPPKRAALGGPHLRHFS